jgi:hypothetical protein
LAIFFTHHKPRTSIAPLPTVLLLTHTPSPPLQATPTTSNPNLTKTPSTPAPDTNAQAALSTPAKIAIATLSGLLLLALLAVFIYYVVIRRRKRRDGRGDHGLGGEIPWSAVETYTNNTATTAEQQSPMVGGAVGVGGGDAMHVKVEGDQQQQQQEGGRRAELPGRGWGREVVEMSADGRHLR